MRRLGWVAIGFGLGAAATHRATRGGRAPAVATTAGAAASLVRRRVGAALTEGRAEMREREARLRDVFAAPGDPGEPPTGERDTEGRR